MYLTSKVARQRTTSQEVNELSKTKAESFLSEYHEKVGRMWSGTFYDNYKSVEWPWYNYPFQTDYTKPRGAVLPAPDRVIDAKSIIEIGSAMGQGYATLKESGLVNLSGFSGYDSSEDGQKFCRETYPEANWVEGDFTKNPLKEKFEYGYERHAIHHMPDPLKQQKKVMEAVEKAVIFTFRGRVRGETVSDLTKSYINHTTSAGFAAGGRVFLNQINVLDTVRMGHELGYNHIGIRVGIHEPVQSDDPDRFGLYIDPEVKNAGGSLLRFTVLLAREEKLSQPLVYAFPGQRRVLLTMDYFRLKKALSAFR